MAALYAEQWAKDVYWKEEDPAPEPWKAERCCEHCSGWYVACRPTQRFCSYKCRGDHHNWNKYKNVLPAWKLAYQSGMSMDDICKKWKAPKETVHKLLNYYGVAIRDKRKFLKHAGDNY